ncbi:hypothetical protein HDV06_000786 [Boothiomyces sp. JEL0866]|nr:hypothetical protein HDV06_000786 [Boothiomyces sp. JEL0866]
MLNRILNELAIIGRFLDIVSYHNLRFAFTNILPTQQLINPMSLDQNIDIDLSQWITIPAIYINDKVILQLFENRQHQLLTLPEYKIPQNHVAYFMLKIISAEYDLNPDLVLKLLPLLPDGTKGFVGSSLETARTITNDSSFHPVRNIPMLLNQCLRHGYMHVVKALLSSSLEAVGSAKLPPQLYSPELLKLVLANQKVVLSRGDILYYPIEHGLVDAVEIILSSPGVGFLSHNLKYAFSKNYKDIARLILHYEEFNYSSVYDYEKELFEFVFDNLPVPQQHAGNMFIAAVEKESRVSHGIYHQVDLTKFGGKALLIACAKGSFDIVKKLLGSPEVDPNVVKNENGWRSGLLPLFLKHTRFEVESRWAVEHCIDLFDLEHLLQDKRVDPTISNFLIKYAADEANMEMFKLLLPLEFDLSVDNNYVFRKIVSKKARNMLELLLRDPRFNMELPTGWLELNGLKV